MLSPPTRNPVPPAGTVTAMGSNLRRRGIALATAAATLTAVVVAPRVWAQDDPAPSGLPGAPAAAMGPSATTTEVPPGTAVDRERRTEPEDRYALAGGCYAVRSEGSGRYLARDGAGGFAATAPTAEEGEPFHLQATDLGRYLLYGTAGDHLAVGGRSAAGPSGATDWSVLERGDGTFALVLSATGDQLTVGPDGGLGTAPASRPTTSFDAGFGFRLVDGCAPYPEIDLDVSGPHVTGTTPYGEVTGYVDDHLHVMAFEFLGGRAHCGVPWHPYGVAHALVDCPDHLIADGAAAVLENFLDTRLGGIPLAQHDPAGWPTFRDWPAPTSLTHEQVYYRWLERAWRGGLRVLSNLFTDNRVLCEVYPLKKNDCDEMASVRLQVARTRQLERYIDAQSGGPGEGWFRIVDDPFEARAVANEGKLAVILGIEISEPFGCSLRLGVPQCTTDDIDRALDELWAMGIRQAFAIHKFDNALGGTTGDGGGTGLVVNAGQLLGTGALWNFQACPPGAGDEHDNHQLLPIYPEGPQCNVLGLTDLGRYALRAMAARGFVIDIDHMSVKARGEALALLEADGYPGVLSSHSWATPSAYPRVHALGGFVAPYAGDSRGFVEAWRTHRATFDTSRYPFAIGYGADSNGLGIQGSPRGADAENPVTYPFSGLGGVVLDRQVSGTRVFDINRDGVAHYGLYPDWIEDLRRLGGDEIVIDLARGAEGYLQMWERAFGVPARGCRSGAEVQLGMTAEEVLRAAGQPEARVGRAFHYCGGRTVTFDAAGRVAAVVA